jgi:hypothetical protein
LSPTVRVRPTEAESGQPVLPGKTTRSAIRQIFGCAPHSLNPAPESQVTASDACWHVSRPTVDAAAVHRQMAAMPARMTFSFLMHVLPITRWQSVSIGVPSNEFDRLHSCQYRTLPEVKTMDQAPQSDTFIFQYSWMYRVISTNE